MEHPILKRRQVVSIYVFKEGIWSSLKNASLYLEFIAILGKQQLQEGHSLENAPDGKRDRWKTKPIHWRMPKQEDGTCGKQNPLTKSAFTI